MDECIGFCTFLSVHWRPLVRLSQEGVTSDQISSVAIPSIWVFIFIQHRVVRIKCENELSIFNKCKAVESSYSTLIITTLMFLRVHIPEIYYKIFVSVLGLT